MDIARFNKLKKDRDEYNHKCAKIEAQKAMVIKQIEDKLKAHGIDSIKDYKKLFSMRDELKPKAESLLEEYETKLKESQNKLSEIERDISQ